MSFRGCFETSSFSFSSCLLRADAVTDDADFAASPLPFELLGVTKTLSTLGVLLIGFAGVDDFVGVDVLPGIEQLHVPGFRAWLRDLALQK